MLKKDLGLLILILVVGTVVALINPRFISPINLANTANLIGLFGLFSIGEGFVIITGGIDLSIGSMFALLGVIFVDLLVTYRVPWPVAVADHRRCCGIVLGSIHGFLITQDAAAALRRHAVRPPDLSRHRALLHGRRHGRLRLRPELPDARMADRRAHASACRTASSPSFSSRSSWGCVLHRSVFGRYLFAVGKNEEAARYSGIRTRAVIAAAYIICGALAGLSAVFLAMYTRSISPASHGNFYELYGIAAAVLGGCSLRGGEGSILGIVLGTILLQVLQNLVNLLGIPSSLNFAVMGARDPDRRARRPAIRRLPARAQARADLGLEPTPAGGSRIRAGSDEKVDHSRKGRCQSRDLPIMPPRPFV